MFTFVKSLYASQYMFRVALALGSEQETVDSRRFPACIPLVRRARIMGITAKQCAEIIRSIVRGADGGPMDSATRDMVINAAMESMESNEPLWARRWL